MIYDTWLGCNHSSFPLSGSTITNDGTITVNKGATNSGTGIGINGAVDLTGTGSINLNAYHDPTSGASNALRRFPKS